MKRYAELGLGLFAGLIVAWMAWAGLFSGPEKFFEDILFSDRQASPDVVIVAIDNKSISAIGQWPWKREVFADLLIALSKQKPAAVGIDVVFSEPSRHGEADDAALSRVLGSLAYPVVMPIEADPLSFGSTGKAQAEAVILPLAQFAGPAVSLAHVNLIIDPDGVVRTVPFSVLNTQSGIIMPAFAVSSAQKSGFARTLGNADTDGIERIAFAGRPGTVKHVSFIDALSSSTAQALFAGKLIFVGATASDLHDEQLTPVSRGVPMSGVEIQAQIANMVIQGTRLASVSTTMLFLWIIIAALIPAIFFTFAKSTRLAIILSVCVSLLHIVLVVVLFGYGYVGNILHVNLAWMLGILFAFLFRHFVLEREKRDMRNVFSKYVSKDVLEDILRDTSKVKLGGEEREATVFFSDVRGFTTLSESLTPIQLTQFLNRYLTLMTDIALSHRGVVDKYIGDAIMVFWGAPLSNPNHVLDTMRASLAMIDALHAFNKDSAGRKDPPIDIGIGFNSGKVIAGNMGSEQRFDYTVMGDTVNLASRLEGQTKTYGIHIIASEYTMAMISKEELDHHGIYAREIDRIRVKGKKLPVTIYEVVENAKIEFVKGIREQFDALRIAYYAGDWSTVVDLAVAIRAQGNDGPTNVLAERAEHFMHNAPDHWDGVYDMKTK